MMKIVVLLLTSSLVFVDSGFSLHDIQKEREKQPNWGISREELKEQLKNIILSAAEKEEKESRSRVYGNIGLAEIVTSTVPPKVVTTETATKAKQAACPQSYPYAYLNGKQCCKYDKESITSVKDELCDGSAIGITSVCCKDDKSTYCLSGSCGNYVPACPHYYPYAYLNGQRCCRYGKEKSNLIDGEFCDGGTIGITSVCCKDDESTYCPSVPCGNYVPVSHKLGETGSKEHYKELTALNSKTSKKLEESKEFGKIGRSIFDTLLGNCPIYIILKEYIIGHMRKVENVSSEYPIIFNVTPVAKMDLEYAIKFDVYPTALSGKLVFSLRSNDETVAHVTFSGQGGKYKVNFCGKVLHASTSCYLSSGKSYEKDKYIKIRIVQYKHDGVIRHITSIDGELVRNIDFVKSMVYVTEISKFSISVVPEIGKRPSIRGLVIGATNACDKNGGRDKELNKDNA